MRKKAKIAFYEKRFICFTQNIRNVGRKTRDSWSEPRPEIHDLSQRWDPDFKTQDFKGGTWDPGLLLYMRVETRDTKSETWKLYNRWKPRPKTNISLRIWDSRTKIHMNLIKCPRNRIWVINSSDLQSYYKTVVAYAIIFLLQHVWFIYTLS